MVCTSCLAAKAPQLQRNHLLYGHHQTLTASTNVLKPSRATEQQCMQPTESSYNTADLLPRRQMCLGIGSIFIATQATTPQSSHAVELTTQQPLDLYVSQTPKQAGDPGLQFSSINAALKRLDETPSDLPAVLHVAAGTYNERLVLTRPNVKIQAWPQGANVEVVWRTPEPYQSVVDVTAKGVMIQGLTLKHASKSIANNYGVYIHEGSDVTLQDCDISSSTGTGIGIEGANPTIKGCRIHGCTRHGVAVFGALDPFDPPGGGLLQLWAGINASVILLMEATNIRSFSTVWDDCSLLDVSKTTPASHPQECDVSENAGDGVLVRSGAEPKLDRCIIHDNKGWGISLQDDSNAELVANSVRGNGQGAVKVTASFDFDAGMLSTQNTLLGKVLLK